MRPSLKIAVDRGVVDADQTFGAHGHLLRFEGRSVRREDLLDSDVLIVRSVTRVGRRLLHGTRVRFVGSATIGTDHLDLGWLGEEGITWAHAPGCNAEGASQYTLGLILLACKRLGLDPGKQSVGILGRGNVGSRLQGLLDALGIASRACDPPLKMAGAEGLVSRDAVLDCSIVSLHVPLTRTGPYPTFRSFERSTLRGLRAGKLLVNAARGDVIDETALLAELRTGRIHVALDVWPREPNIDRSLLAATTVATPHVGGYSLDGRMKGTRAVYAAFRQWAGIVAAGQEPAPPEAPGYELGNQQGSVERLILDVTRVEADDRALRSASARGGAELAADFDRLRLHYPPRRDFRAVRVASSGANQLLLERLGFRVSPLAEPLGHPA